MNDHQSILRHPGLWRRVLLGVVNLILGATMAGFVFAFAHFYFGATTATSLIPAIAVGTLAVLASVWDFARFLWQRPSPEEDGREFSEACRQHGENFLSSTSSTRFRRFLVMCLGGFAGSAQGDPAALRGFGRALQQLQNETDRKDAV